MFVLDILGAVLTLITLLFLFLGGYLLARLLLRERAETDPLALAVATLLAATAEAGVIGLAIGFPGQLKFALGLILLVIIALLLLRQAKAGGGDPWLPLRVLGGRVRDRVREHPVMALIAVHAAASEGLRGLIRPPLSWDSIMYHLFITATWLQNGRIAPVFGARPMNFYGYQPSGASVWMWWWMAPSHSELYINLTFFPQAVLLALAAGGVARQLGARRHWPLAAFLSFLAPVVIRFAATQYVDIYVGSAIAAAAFFMLLWIEEPRWGTAILAGAGLGASAGAKVLGLAYTLTLAPAALLMARGEWRKRIPQIAASLVMCAMLGAPFYIQNVIAGASAMGARCDDSVPGSEQIKTMPTIPRINTVAYLFPEMIKNGQLVDAFLGVTYPGSQELGLGPQVLLLLPVFLLPLAFPRGQRRGALLIWSHIVLQIIIWVTVPFASEAHVFANVRYLIGALGLCFAGVVAMAERFRGGGMSDAWIRGIAVALLIQDLLQLHAEMPHSVRLVIGAVDIIAVALALSPGFRDFMKRRGLVVASAVLAVAILCVPYMAIYHNGDRARAYAMEYTAHKTAAPNYAKAWHFLDLYGGDGTVAVHGTPMDFFVYPAMGTHLERRALYVNVNRKDSRNAADYPRCVPRVDLDPQAWVENLYKQDVRWLLVSRFPQIDFPEEYAWATARPDLFTVRFQDQSNVIFEFLPWQKRREVKQ